MFKKIFGLGLVIFGALFDLADFYALYTVTTSGEIDYTFELGLLLAFILFGGIAMIMGGVHLLREN